MDHPTRHLDLVTFAQANPAGHLVAGVVTGEVRVSELSALRRHLRRLVEALGIEGCYATGLVRTAVATEMHCLFERADDACRLGAWLNARWIDCHVGPAGERQFLIDEAVRVALREAAAGTGFQRGRPGQPGFRTA